ncbi:MAG: pilus assembly protein TadG-related protein [Deltaproteobacteria bacterium]|nr:pilus assembly protein TadG-related protein [Deltaproteobacteria bacterium]
MIHRLRRDEEGQTLVLGAVSMLVLALAVMTTISIGEAAYEKIKLQNTADAAAYSLAATQARAFNFFAYTNRAMIAHYNTALTMVAYLSFCIYVNNTLGRLAGLLKYIPIPVFSQVMTFIEKALEIVTKALRIVVAVVLPIVNIVNGAYFLFQMGMLGVLAAQLLQNSGIVYENDPDAVSGVDLGNLNAGSVFQVLIKGFNGMAVYNAFDFKSTMALVPVYGANRNFDNVKNTNGPQIKNAAGQDRGNEGRLIMNELINAGRHPWVTISKNGTPFLGRKWRINIGILGFGIEFKKSARTEHNATTGMGSRSNSRHDMIFSVDQFYIRLYAPSYWFKITYNSFVLADYKKGGELEQLQVKDKKCGKWNWRCKLGKAITAPVREILKAAFKAFPGLNRLKEKKYYWFGITPFMKFNPSPKWREVFHQPQFMMLVSKPDEKLNKLQDTAHRSYGMDTKVEVGSGAWQNRRGSNKSLNLEVDVTDESSFISSLMPGFNALSVARSYYHRPGEWKEHPNFFNPFWAAKLDPVAHHAMIGEIPHLANFGDEIILH